MAKLNLNDETYKSRYEPIEIEGFAGRDWKINKISDEMAAQILEFSKEITDTETDMKPEMINRFLGIVFGEDTETFKSVDWRIKQDVVLYIFRNINLSGTDQSAEGNEFQPDIDR